MIDPQLIAFTGVVAGLTVIPSATTLLITQSVIVRGQNAGFLVILGGSLGVYVHAVLSALGLSLILVQSAQLVEITKLLGAIYLIWLGVQSVWRGLYLEDDISQPEQISLIKNRGEWKSFLEGFTTIILSPEASIFYLAMLPQFINSGDSVLTKSLMLASIHVVIRITWYSLLTVFFGRVTTVLSRSRVKRWIELSSGVALVLFGFKVATAKR